jgi:hypothetical protein
MAQQITDPDALAILQSTQTAPAPSTSSGITDPDAMAILQSTQTVDNRAPAVAAPSAAPAPSTMDQLSRAFTMAGRNVAHGVMSIPGLINDPIVNTLNYAEGKLGVDPKYRFGTAAQATDAVLNAAGVPDYQPQNGTDRVAGRIEQALGGVMGGNALGGVFGGTANTGSQIIGNALRSNLGQQATAVTAGATAGGLAHEAGASPRTELALSLLGAASPTAYELGAQATAGAAARLFGSVSPETAQLARTAQQYGIPLKASQLSDSRIAKTLDSTSQQVPFSGGKDFADVQQQAFNRAVGNTIGLDSPKITPELFNQAVGRIGSEFDRLTANNSIPLSPQLMDKLRGISQDAGAYYGPESQSMVNQTVQRLVDQSQNGVIPGRVYQSVDSKLGQAVRSGGERSAVLGNLQDTLRDAMEANLNPADAQAWQVARQQWRDMRTIEPLVGKSVNGDISAAGLMGRVTANQAGKTSMARGTRGDLGDLARIGQQFIKDQIPDSGTARRLGTLEALKGTGALLVGAGAAYDPLKAILGAGALVGSSRSAQGLLQNPRVLNSMLGNSAGSPNLMQSVGASLNPTTQALLQQQR